MTKYQDSIVMDLEEEWTSPRTLGLKVDAATGDIFGLFPCCRDVGKCSLVEEIVLC